MSSAADSFALQNSMIREDTAPDFTSKQWTFMNDQNQGNYSTKQLVFDLSGFYNSQRFINLAEMLLVIPLVTTLSADDQFVESGTKKASQHLDGLGTKMADPSNGVASYVQDPTQLFAVGFKSGYYNLIYSMSVNVDGQDVIQLTPNINYYCSFMANTKFGLSDIAKHGPMIGFLPDDELSWGVNSSQIGNANGYGVYNNTLPPSDFISRSGGPAKLVSNVVTNKQISAGMFSTPSTYRSHVNRGLYERMLHTSTYVNPTMIQSGLTGATLSFPADPKRVIAGQGSIASDDFTKIALGDGCYVVNGANDSNSGALGCPNAGAGAARVWLTTAVIRFKDICQLFEKLPITRSLYIRLLINLNIGHLSVYNPHLITDSAPASGDQKAIPYSTAQSAAFTYSSTSVATSASTDFVNTPLCGTASCVPTYIPACSPFERTLDSVPSNTNVNAATFTSTVTPRFGYGYIYDNTFQGTCPLMLAKCVSSFYTNSQAAATYGDTTTPTDIGAATQLAERDLLPGLNCGLYSQYRNAIKLSISVAKPDSAYHSNVGSALTSYNHGLTSTRVYAPSIELEPSKALAYLENHKEQEIRYNDVLALVYPGVAAGQSFNYFAANGIANAKRVIVIPFFHDDSTPSGTATTVTSSWANASGVAAPNYYNTSCSRLPFQPISPFDSAPATTAPMAYLRNFNVLLSNANVFQRNIDYDFEMFCEEVSPANAINGGLDTGLTSGIIDLRKWRNNYRYYVADLSRRLAGDNAPKSVTLQGMNDTLYPMDLYIFIEYERKFSLNVETGHISM